MRGAQGIEYSTLDRLVRVARADDDGPGMSGIGHDRSDATERVPDADDDTAALLTLRAGAPASIAVVAVVGEPRSWAAGLYEVPERVVGERSDEVDGVVGGVAVAPMGGSGQDVALRGVLERRVLELLLRSVLQPLLPDQADQPLARVGGDLRKANGSQRAGRAHGFDLGDEVVTVDVVIRDGLIVNGADARADAGAVFAPRNMSRQSSHVDALNRTSHAGWIRKIPDLLYVEDWPSLVPDALLGQPSCATVRLMEEALALRAVSTGGLDQAETEVHAMLQTSSRARISVGGGCGRR